MAKIRLDIDPVDKILLKRSLNKNGAGQKVLHPLSKTAVHTLCAEIKRKPVNGQCDRNSILYYL